MKHMTPVLKWLPATCGAILAALGLGFFLYIKLLPPHGNIDFRFDGMSSSEVYFWLDNRSDRAIFTNGRGGEVWSSEILTSCKAKGETSENLEPPPFVDGQASIIRVSPGDKIRLTIKTSLPHQYLGGSCRIRLSLLGGVFIESQAFRPQ
jgi:hypothetical protein